MPVSKAQQKAVNKYVRENYDKLLLTMPKGRKAEIQAAAAAQGESVNGFINRSIDHEMARDASGSPVEATGAPAVAGVLSLPQAPEAPPDGALVLIERGLVSVGRGDMRTMYTAPDTGREYYVEPVISDDEWNDLQRAKATSEDDPDTLPF